MNIALIGMMGSMKSSTGRELARILMRPLFDTDDVFVIENDMSVSAAFEEFGEQFFRDKESEIIRRLCAYNEAVISCGGGLPLREENRRALKESCFTVRLTASPEVIYERVKHNTGRPLLAEMSLARIKELMAARDGDYAAAADMTVDTDGRLPADIAAEIAGKLPAGF